MFSEACVSHSVHGEVSPPLDRHPLPLPLPDRDPPLDRDPPPRTETPSPDRDPPPDRDPLLRTETPGTDI